MSLQRPFALRAAGVPLLQVFSRAVRPRSAVDRGAAAVPIRLERRSRAEMRPRRATTLAGHARGARCTGSTASRRPRRPQRRAATSPQLVETTPDFRQVEHVNSRTFARFSLDRKFGHSHILVWEISQTKSTQVPGKNLDALHREGRRAKISNISHRVVSSVPPAGSRRPAPLLAHPSGDALARFHSPSLEQIRIHRTYPRRPRRPRGNDPQGHLRGHLRTPTPPTTTPAPADPAVAAASTPGTGNVAPTPPRSPHESRCRPNANSTVRTSPRTATARARSRERVSRPPRDPASSRGRGRRGKRVSRLDALQRGELRANLLHERLRVRIRHGTRTRGRGRRTSRTGIRPGRTAPAASFAPPARVARPGSRSSSTPNASSTTETVHPRSRSWIPPSRGIHHSIAHLATRARRRGGRDSREGSATGRGARAPTRRLVRRLARPPSRTRR